jgi:hypothetical protein
MNKTDKYYTGQHPRDQLNFTIKKINLDNNSLTQFSNNSLPDCEVVSLGKLVYLTQL